MSEVSLKFLRFHCLDRHHCAVHYRHLIDRIVQRFQEANAEVAVDSTVMRNWYQLMYTLHRDLGKEDGPDVFHTCGGGELQDLVDKGLVYDLSRELDSGWRDSFVPAAWHPLRFTGREYAVPLEQGFVFVWYNKRIFEKLGLTVPTQFDELLGICAEVKRAGIVPFAVGNRERWPGAFFFSHLFHRIGGRECSCPISPWRRTTGDPGQLHCRSREPPEPCRSGSVR